MPKQKDQKTANEFARRLNARLEALRISQKRLADITGISPMQIHNYLHGKCIPRIDTATKLAFGLAMPVEDLIDFEVD